MTQDQKNKISEIVESNIDQMLYEVLNSVDAQTGDEAPFFAIKLNTVIDELIELAIEHANNNLKN